MGRFARKRIQPQIQTPSNAGRTHAAMAGLPLRESSLLDLQRTAGNQAVQRMLQPRAEREADAMAEQIPGGASAAPRPQRKSAGHSLSGKSTSQHSGSPMDRSTRSFMEDRFGRDFSDVRIHTDSGAVQLSRALNAQAFTVGRDVYFDGGKYSPASPSGRRLLAHELTHTLQQSEGGATAIQRKPNTPEEPETEVVDARYYASAKALQDMRKKIDACKLTKLSQTKITPQSTVDAQTPQVLDEVMERAWLCGSLSAYIALKSTKVSQRVAIHPHKRGDNYLTTPDTHDASGSRFDSNEYNVAVRKYLENTPSFRSKSLGDQRAEIRQTGGFYDRGDDRIHLPGDSAFGNALHESVHRQSGFEFYALYGQYLNEGVTQYFADVILNDEGLPADTSNAYQPQVADARLLIQRLGTGGQDLVAQLYFQQIQAAHWEILLRLGLIKNINERRGVRPSDILTAIRTPAAAPHH